MVTSALIDCCFIRQVVMENLCRELPEDCWEMIIVRLGHHRHWEPLSLVSKKFLSITNRLRVSLKIINPSIEVLHKQLQRFQQVRRIDFRRGSLDEALLEMARSGVNIEELDILGYISGYFNCWKPRIMLFKDLGSIKVLRWCSSCLRDSDLVVMAEYLPLIEELDISCQPDITDEGVAAMSMKLKRLRMIDLPGNRNISDQSLISLSSNCESLTEIKLHRCNNVSQAGISFVMENSHSYNSLILAADIFHYLELTNPLNFSKCTKTIDLCRVKVSDEFLFGIVKADLPLETFHLDNCSNFTINDIYFVLRAYPSLKSLSLCGVDEMLTDECVIHMCQFISKLSSIRINSCNKLTSLSFIAIASACPWISNIEIDVLSQEEAGIDFPSGFEKNPSITSVTLPSSAIERLLHICPNLEVLKVSGIEDEHFEVDIAFILKSCHNTRHLTVDLCNRLKFTEEGENKPCKLEWLSATFAWIDNNVLKMVGKRCPDLHYLALEGCWSVTKREVREMVLHCGRLRYINLNLFTNFVNKDFVAWMVSSCPLLREIVITGPVERMFGVPRSEPYLVLPRCFGCVLVSGFE